MTAPWESNKTVVEIQTGGPGNPILLLDPSATVTGHSGGGQDVEDRFVRDTKRGAGAYKRAGVVVSSDPARYTFDLTTRLLVSDFINSLSKRSCEHVLRVRNHCGDVEDVTNYLAALAYHQTFGTGQTLTENPANGTTAVSPDVMVTVNESASELVPVVKVQHLNISGSISDFAINKVIAVGVAQCAGACGLENDGNQEFWAVTDEDTTPGYGGTGAPNFLYTEDGGGTWTAVAIDVFLSGNATDVLKIGGYVLVLSETNGIAYARFADIKDGVANPWALASGFSGSFPNAFAQASGNIVYAVGDGGRIWRSTDGGQSFTAVATAGQVTSSDLLSTAFVSETLGWIGGASGTLVKFFNGAFSLVTVTDGTNTVSSDITSIAVPEDRDNEIYLTAAGEVWRSRNQGVTWERMSFPGSGSGTVDDLQFSGPGGFHLWLIHTRASDSKSRVLRDLSGGALSFNIEVIGSYDSPANSRMNSIAPSNANTALVVGELNGSVAFVGKIS